VEILLSKYSESRQYSEDNNVLNKRLNITSDLSINESVYRSANAQKNIVNVSESLLNNILERISKRVDEKRRFFAEQTVFQTGMGNVEHKIHKIGLVCNDVSKHLQTISTTGKINVLQDHTLQESVTEYASPVKVIFAVIPSTNPVPNSLFKILHALKTRNSLILSYPRSCIKLAGELIAIVQSVLKEYELPKDLVQLVPLPSDRVQVNKFMSHPNVDLVLATGGAALVKAAYCSGNPAYGVGPGNVPALVYPDADLQQAAESIVISKSYDNGIICGAESNLIVAETISAEFVVSLENSHAAVLSVDEKKKALDAWFNDGALSKDVIGKHARVLAKMADIKRDYDIQVFVIPVNKQEEHCLCKEKLAPILSLIECKQPAMLETALKLLAMQGEGHSASIFSSSAEIIEAFANTIPAGRLLVNTPATFGMMGVSTDLPLSFMLGSGTWGGNLTTEAITWRHFVNIKRLATGTQHIQLNQHSNKNMRR